MLNFIEKKEDLRTYLRTAAEIAEEKPVPVNHDLRGKEVETDAVCDGSKRSVSPSLSPRKNIHFC